MNNKTDITIIRANISQLLIHVYSTRFSSQLTR